MLRKALTLASLVALAGYAHAGTPKSTATTAVLCDDLTSKFTASITIFLEGGLPVAKMKFGVKGFPANTPVECGYHCAAGGGTPVLFTCGGTDEKGKWGIKVDFIPNSCAGVVPFVKTATPGPSCLLTIP